MIGPERQLMVSRELETVDALRRCLWIMSYYHKSERGHLDSCECPECCGHCIAVNRANAVLDRY
jgi:hypothetical protein